MLTLWSGFRVDTLDSSEFIMMGNIFGTSNLRKCTYHPIKRYQMSGVILPIHVVRYLSICVLSVTLALRSWARGAAGCT